MTKNDKGPKVLTLGNDFPYLGSVFAVGAEVVIVIPFARESSAQGAAMELSNGKEDGDWRGAVKSVISGLARATKQWKL